MIIYPYPVNLSCDVIASDGLDQLIYQSKHKKAPVITFHDYNQHFGKSFYKADELVIVERQYGGSDRWYNYIQVINLLLVELI